MNLTEHSAALAVLAFYEYSSFKTQIFFKCKKN